MRTCYFDQYFYVPWTPCCYNWSSMICCSSIVVHIVQGGVGHSRQKFLQWLLKCCQGKLAVPGHLMVHILPESLALKESNFMHAGFFMWSWYDFRARFRHLLDSWMINISGLLATSQVVLIDLVEAALAKISSWAVMHVFILFEMPPLVDQVSIRFWPRWSSCNIPWSCKLTLEFNSHLWWLETRMCSCCNLWVKLPYLLHGRDLQYPTDSCSTQHPPKSMNICVLQFWPDVLYCKIVKTIVFYL